MYIFLLCKPNQQRLKEIDTKVNCGYMFVAWTGGLGEALRVHRCETSQFYLAKDVITIKICDLRVSTAGHA